MCSINMHVGIFTNKPAPAHLHKLDRRASKLPRHVSFSSTAAATRLRASMSVQQEVDETRRDGNYQPSVWDSNYIQSLNNQYKEERYVKRQAELIEQVKMLLEEEDVEVNQRLELIDDLNNLGLSYFFKDKIKQILDYIYDEGRIFKSEGRDLYITALGFRLLRQHGFDVSQEVFDCFKNEEGTDFKASLVDDAKGLLQLYDASFLVREGEDILEEATQFATKSLQKKLDEGGDGIDDDNLLSSIHRSMDLPLHWRIQRYDSRWFLDDYARRPDKNPVIFELAKLNFNSFQATQVDELKEIIRWWNNSCLAEKLPFARDRIVESYFWSIGVFEGHEYGYERKTVSKIIAFVTIIDDIYDVYGTLDELQLFTDTIRRLHNILGDLGASFNYSSCIARWLDLAEAYLKEAKWYYSGYTPSLEEYLNNAKVSITSPTITSQAYFSLHNTPADKTVIDSMYKYHDILYLSGMILRLADDLGTTSFELERGDVAKAMQCYMKDRNASEEEAREHVRFLIVKSWKEMNTAAAADDCPFTDALLRAAANLGRAAQFFYHEGDGHGVQHSKIHQQIAELLFQPYV